MSNLDRDTRASYFRILDRPNDRIEEMRKSVRTTTPYTTQYIKNKTKQKHITSLPHSPPAHAAEIPCCDTCDNTKHCTCQLIMYIVISLSLFLAHGARWLVAERSVKKRIAPPPPQALWEGNTLFYGPERFGGKIYDLIWMKIKKGLGMFVGKVRTITRPGTFLETVYL